MTQQKSASGVPEITKGLQHLPVTDGIYVDQPTLSGS